VTCRLGGLMETQSESGRHQPAEQDKPGVVLRGKGLAAPPVREGRPDRNLVRDHARRRLPDAGLVTHVER